MGLAVTIADWECSYKNKGEKGWMTYWQRLRIKERCRLFRSQNILAEADKSCELAILVPIWGWNAQSRVQHERTTSSCFLWTNTFPELNSEKIGRMLDECQLRNHSRGERARVLKRLHGVDRTPVPSSGHWAMGKQKCRGPESVASITIMLPLCLRVLRRSSFDFSLSWLVPEYAKS